MKKIIKNPIFTFILGALIFGGIGVVSAYTILANDIRYTPKDTTWKKSSGEDITNVQDAIDELYNKTSSSSSLLNKICTYQSEGSYGQKVQVGALYDCEVGPNIHKNFYILTIRDKEVDMIMDRNINNGTIEFNDAMKYFRNKSEIEWSNVLNVGLPDAQQIVDAVRTDNWIAADNGVTWWCFGSKKQDNSSSPYCTNSNQKNYAWLFNHLSGCKSAGCTDDSDATSNGYWTRDLIGNSGYAWGVAWAGTLDFNQARGIRPVITVLKSQLN